MKLKFRWNVRLTAGTIIGAVSPMLMLPLVLLIIAYLQNYYFSQLWFRFSTIDVYQSKYLSLSIIPNLVWFFLFLNKERYDIAKGIIVGSVLYLPFFVYVNLIR